MSAHTPGPWTAEREPGVGFLIQPHGAVVADCCQEHEADAHLIAAAPELLEALRKTVARIKRLGRGMHSYQCATNPRESPADPRCIDPNAEPIMLPPGKCDCGALEWAHDIDAALAKARGGK